MGCTFYLLPGGMLGGRQSPRGGAIIAVDGGGCGFLLGGVLLLPGIDLVGAGSRPDGGNRSGFVCDLLCGGAVSCGGYDKCNYRKWR